MENQSVYVYGVSTPTTVDSDGKVTRILDKNGAEYVTIYAHGQDEDADGRFIEPVKAVSTMNSAITPLMYAHLIKMMTKNGTVAATAQERKAANVDDGQELLMLKKPVVFAGIVEKRKTPMSFIIEGSENVGNFVSFVGWGSIELASASVDAQFESRMQYYTDNDQFIEASDIADYKAAVKKAPTAQLTSVIGG